MKNLIPCVLLVFLIACGGGGNNTPTSPSGQTPAPQANRAPVINSMSFSPSFGIAGLTSFNFASSASDPDGDSLSYNWDIAGNGSSSASGVMTFTNGGTGTATLTVSDGKGGTVRDSRNFVVGTLTGSWSGTLIGSPFILNATQNVGGFVTATWNQPGTPMSGQLDPAAPNRINADGTVTMRIKVTAGGRFNDFTFTGVLESSGTRLTGSLNGSGFTGTPFTLVK